MSHLHRSTSSMLLVVAALLLFTSPALAATAPRPDGYVRPGWADLNHDGMDTRAEVLQASCALVTWDAKHHHVRHAECLELYSGVLIATDSAGQALHVDHLYPASQAWKRRAWHMTDGSKCMQADRCPEFIRFYNDPRNLVVTRARTNLRKSDKMPGEWCPEWPDGRKLVAAMVLNTVTAWDLPMSKADWRAVAYWHAGACALEK